MSKAVKIADITITVRPEVVRLFVTATEKEKDRRRTAILQTVKGKYLRFNFRQIQEICQGEFYDENYEKILTSSQSM